MYRHSILRSTAVIGITVALAACGGGGVNTSAVPTKATVNGFYITPEKKAQLNVSAIDGANKVLTSGTITEVSVANTTSVSATAAAPLATYAGAATVCGNITAPTGHLAAAVTLDATGSMADTDPPAVPNDFTTTKRNQAAKTFIQRLSANDKAAVSSFDTYTSASVSYLAIRIRQDFTSDKAALGTAVNTATFEGGGTNLWDAAFDSAGLVNTQSTGNKVAVILTDGENNSGSKTVDDAIARAKANNVRVFTVGLGSSINATQLQKLSNATQGTYAAAGNAAQLDTAFNNIFNATQGAGCVEVTFTPTPTTGAKVTGTLSFKVNGKLLSTTFNIQY